MHILFLTNEYPKKGVNGGGIGSFVQFLARKLVQQGVFVSVIGINNTHKNEADTDEGVKIHRLPKSKWKVAKFYQHTQRILAKIKEIEANHKIDIVEGSELNFAFFPTKTTYKKVIRLHGGHHFFAIELNKKPALWRGFQEKQSFKKADAYVAVSNYVGMQTQKYLHYKFPFTTIYNSVDCNKFTPADVAKVKPNSLLFVGTVCEKKGVRQLVQALPLIKKEIPDVHLKIVGRDWFFRNGDSYIDYLKTFITDDIKKHIEIVGAVPHTEIPKLIEEANVCVYPSHMESFGLTVIEALLMGKPVVCSNIKPFLEIKGERNILKTFAVNNIEDLATAIINTLQSVENSVEMGKLAKKDILKRFNPEIIVAKNIDFYNKIIQA